jgi:hypothetical protein
MSVVDFWSEAWEAWRTGRGREEAKSGPRESFEDCEEESVLGFRWLRPSRRLARFKADADIIPAAAEDAVAGSGEKSGCRAGPFMIFKFSWMAFTMIAMTFLSTGLFSVPVRIWFTIWLVDLPFSVRSTTRKYLFGTRKRTD